MTRAPRLDFAVDRAARGRHRQWLLAALCLALGLQLGLGAWRWQSLDAAQAELLARQRQAAGQRERVVSVELTPEQRKVADAAQAMLERLAVPWERMLAAIEGARGPRVFIDTIQPHADAGSVSISVNCADFADLAEFIRALDRQDDLSDVMLVSEALPDTGAGPLRAVISANWRQLP